MYNELFSILTIKILFFKNKLKTLIVYFNSSDIWFLMVFTTSKKIQNIGAVKKNCTALLEICKNPFKVATRSHLIFQKIKLEFWLIFASYWNKFFQICHPNIFYSITIDDNNNLTKIQLLKNFTFLCENIDCFLLKPFLTYLG